MPRTLWAPKQHPPSFISQKTMELFACPTLPLASMDNDTSWCDVIECVSTSSGSDGDADLDLGQWEHLTTTYDRAEFFQDSELEPTPLELSFQQQEQQRYQCMSKGGFIGSVSDWQGPSALASQSCSLQQANAMDSGLYKLHTDATSAQLNILRFDPQPSHEKEFLDASSGMHHLYQPAWINSYFQQVELVSTSRTPELLSPAVNSSCLPCLSNDGLFRLASSGRDSCESHAHVNKGACYRSAVSSSKSSVDAAPMITPLTAYNYYYRNERDTIVNGMKHANDALPPPCLDFSPQKMTQLLHHHWTVDPFKKKRQHKKTHGIIEFTKLSRVIAQRWRSLPKHGREFYREVANVDQQRYETYLATLRIQQHAQPPTVATTITSTATLDLSR